MDSHHLFRSYAVTGAGLSNSTAYSTIPSIPNRPSYLKSDVGNSPNSPFSTQVDCDTKTTLNDSQKHSSTENLSGLGLSCNFSLESNDCFHPSSPSVNCRSKSLPIYSGGTSYMQDSKSSQEMLYTLQELGTLLMEPEGDEEVMTLSASCGESSRSKGTVPRSRSWNLEPRGSLVLQSQTSFVSRHRQSTEVVHDEKRQKGITDLSSHYILPVNLKQWLVACGKALSENNIDEFDKLIAKAKNAVSICGEPIQRLGAYMVELQGRKHRGLTYIPCSSLQRT